MALMRPVSNYDFNHNFERGKETSARRLVLLRLIGVFNHTFFSTKTRPVPKCSLTCRNTGIITSDDLSWCVFISDGVRALMRHWG